jgi:hypothetical protein
MHHLPEYFMKYQGRAPNKVHQKKVSCGEIGVRSQSKLQNCVTRALGPTNGLLHGIVHARTCCYCCEGPCEISHGGIIRMEESSAGEYRHRPSRLAHSHGTARPK